MAANLGSSANPIDQGFFGSKAADGTVQTNMVINNGTSGSCTLLGQTTANVSTATVILTSALNGLVIVTGNLVSNVTPRFVDVLLVSGSGAVANVISQASSAGSPATRTYSFIGTSLRVAMGSGSYNINVTQISLSFYL